MENTSATILNCFRNGSIFSKILTFGKCMKMDINKKDHSVQLAEHNEWEAAIRERIASAQSDIATATSSLDNVLYPLKASLE